MPKIHRFTTKNCQPHNPRNNCNMGPYHRIALARILYFTVQLYSGLRTPDSGVLSTQYSKYARLPTTRYCTGYWRVVVCTVHNTQYKYNNYA